MEQTHFTGTLKASELIAKLEEGYVLERLPYWSFGTPEEDRNQSAGFYFNPPTVSHGYKINGWYAAFGVGSANMDRMNKEETLASIILCPERWRCYNRKPDDYPNQFNLSITAENNPKNKLNGLTNSN